MVVKISILLKPIYRCNAIPTKISMTFFAEIKNPYENVYGISRDPNSQKIFKKKSKVGRLTIPDFKTYYKSTVINTVWHWHKDRDIDHWNRIENPEINPHIYSEMTFL